MTNRQTTLRLFWVSTLLTLLLVGCGSDEAAVSLGGDGGSAAGDVGAADGGLEGDVQGPDDTSVADAGTTPDATGSEDVEGLEDTAPADVGPSTCPDLKKCNDGLKCTVDDCKMPGEICAWTLKADACLIGATCYAKGDHKVGADCMICDPAVDPHHFVSAPDGEACDDGQTCTIDGKCATGSCVSKPLVCDDDDLCTADVCVAGLGCTYPPLSTGSCDDGSACTDKDTCLKGQCVGALVDCDDDNACTTDACDLATGCTHTDNTSPCSDGDACTTPDTCAGGKCVAGPQDSCDDGNACTLDTCDPLAGCAWLPTQSPCCTGNVSICDDGNPCTTDLCDPKTSACSQKNNTIKCDDGDACTDKDTCGGGKCAGMKKSCDDGEICTDDGCDKKKGCVHAATADGKACDDGSKCTKNDQCTGGKCIGMGQCSCTPVFSKQVNKLITMQIGTSGKKGQGLDLDQNPKTCAPKKSCADGVDNALASVAALANKQLQDAVDKGSVMMLVEFIDFKQGPIELAIHQGELTAKDAKCDFQKQSCDYLADKSLIDELTCKPKASLKGTLVGNKLVAGGKGTNFPFSLPLTDGVKLELTLYDLRVEGTVTTSGDKVQSLSAILAGAVPKKDLLAAVDALPEEGLPVPKAGIKSLVNSMVEKDIDTNGDGTLDASSIALLITGIPSQIVGVAK